MKYEKGTFTTVPLKQVVGIDPLAQIIYVWLCFHSNQEGQCFPSYNKIMEETGIKTRKTIAKNLELLVKIGVLHKKGSSVKGVCNLYTILIRPVSHGNSPSFPRKLVPVSHGNSNYSKLTKLNNYRRRGNKLPTRPKREMTSITEIIDNRR